MKTRCVDGPIIALGAIAALCLPSQCRGIEYLDGTFEQSVSATVRDYVGDPGFTGIQRFYTTPAANFFPPPPADSNLVGAYVSRTGDCGLTAISASTSLAAFQIDPFSLTSGYAFITQAVDVQGYYHDGPLGTELCVGESYAQVGDGVGDSIRIRFRVDESDGDVVFHAREAWMNVTPDGSGGLGSMYLVKDEVNYAGHGSHLAPGVWTLVMQKRGLYAFTNYDLRRARGQYAASWTFDSTFPGETPSGPILVLIEAPGDDEAPPLFPPIAVNGVNLTFPAQGDIGYTGNVFVGLPTEAVRGPATGALITGYEVTSEYAPITSMIIPELPAGAGNLSIDFGAGPQSVVAGQEVDFGDEGVQSFTLAGFDPAFASAEPDAFVMGLTFADEGLASLNAVPILYHPPGDYDKNGFTDGQDFIAWQQQLGASPQAGQGADGNGDGMVNEADLALWTAHFGAPLTAPISPVPEPALGLLLALQLVAIARFSQASFSHRR